MSLTLRPLAARLAGAFLMMSAVGSAHAAFELIGIGTLSGSSDLSGLTGTLESGNAANILGGMGSGLAWAGGSTFLALPDRGPNAVSYAGGVAVDNTTSYIARFNTINVNLLAAPSAVPAGTLPYTVTPTLQSTTLLWSSTPLTYGTTAGLPSAVPSQNTTGKYYFTGRSDGFTPGLSTNPNNARLDPESIRVSKDGKSVFVSDEYGPYVYQFDRTTGERTRTFTLPANLAVPNQSAVGNTEISGNTVGRVANKGMEGLAISPDGTKLYGIMQSALLQDGGDTSAGKTNRIVEIDIATGNTKEYAVSNQIGTKGYNNSELVAINDHTLAFLPRDGKGLGDGSAAVVKQVWAIDLTGATDVSGLSGDAALQGKLLAKTQMVDLVAMLKAAGFADTQIPAKLEGLAFGEDIQGSDGSWYHTMVLANDNDFLPGVAGDNKFYVMRFTDADLLGKGVTGGLQMQSIAAVPEPDSLVLAVTAMGALGLAVRRRRHR
ncbi:MAG TPA: esterase-like activity of phytase family protein [Aquabacterium sp.]|uniref:esterase-like activity of phytase family protein n=1 Tax=Aquabacterium sp. TaxID=1872578 RepID=UPI002E365D9A|nr:esterase-like activity of phytase family protein [Aquabacterium sp.]HEX5354723.1 esterase-like activity of phytase family protein [Aquabacterium sp.]